MTKVRIERGERRVTVEIKGHANYKGVLEADVVCSAASMLASTFAQYAQKLLAAGVIEDMIAFEYKVERVYVDFIVADKPVNMVMVTALVDIIRTGFDLLIEQYPKNVKYAN